MGYEEEIDIFLRYKAEGEDRARNAIDRISDALARQKAEAEATSARLAQMQTLGLFNLGGDGPEQRSATALQKTINLLEQRLNLEREIDNYMSGQADLDRYMSGEVERQGFAWQKVRSGIADAFGDLRQWFANFFSGNGQASGGDPDITLNILRTILRAPVEGIARALIGLRNVPVIGGPAAGLGAWMDSLGSAGVAALPVLAAVVAVLVAILITIGTLIAALSILVAWIGAAATILGTFAIAGTGTLLFLALLGGGFMAAAAAIIFWGIQLQGGVGASDAATKATKALQTAQEGLDASQLAISKWWATHPYGPQNQKDVLTLAGLQDRLKDSQEKVTNAQNDYSTAVANSQSPLQNLIGTLDTLVAEKLEPLAIKLSNLAINWFDAWALQIGPSVADAGGSVMSWIGDRMIPVLEGLKRIVTALAPDFRAFGGFLADMFDRMGKGRGPLFEIMTEDGIRLIIRVVETLLGWLEQLTNWFLGKGPDGIARFVTYGQLFQEILGGMASWVAEGVMPAFGRFADWVVANWPSIKSTVDKVFDGIKSAASSLGPVLGSLGPFLGILWEQFKMVATNSDNWRVTLFVLWGIVMLLAGALIILFGIIIIVDGWIRQFADSIKAVGDFFNNAGTAIHNFQTKLNSITVPAGLINAYNILAAMNGWPQYPGSIALGPGSGAGSGGGSGGGGGGSWGGGSSTSSSYHVTVNGANTSSPDNTAAAIARALRSFTA